MKLTYTLAKLIFCSIFLSSLVSCKGNKGDIGPAGPQGVNGNNNQLFNNMIKEGVVKADLIDTMPNGTPYSFKVLLSYDRISSAPFLLSVYAIGDTSTEVRISKTDSLNSNSMYLSFTCKSLQNTAIVTPTFFTYHMQTLYNGDYVDLQNGAFGGPALDNLKVYNVKYDSTSGIISGNFSIHFARNSFNTLISHGVSVQNGAFSSKIFKLITD